MARIRSIKPEFFTDPDVAKLDPRARLLYIAMWCAADDFGVGETNINALLGLAFPDSDGITAPILRQFCADIAQHLRVTFYEVRGRHYYAVETWASHQKFETREERRKHPSPDDPDARPDQRILDCADSAPIPRELSGANLALEQGTGNREQGTKDLINADTLIDLDLDCAAEDHPRESIYPTKFEQWWQHYPRKVGKRKALIAWKAARKRATDEQLIEGAKRYAEDPNRTDEYTKHPDGWLNRDGWLDEPIGGTRSVDWSAL